MANRHVVPDGAGSWAVKKAGGSRASSTHDTQDGATDAARRSVKADGGGEVVIHRRDGRIRDSETIKPGNDPFPPRDRK